MQTEGDNILTEAETGRANMVSQALPGKAFLQKHFEVSTVHLSLVKANHPNMLSIEGKWPS